MKNVDSMLASPRHGGVIVADCRVLLALESVNTSHHHLQTPAQRCSGLLFWLQYTLPRLASSTGLPLLQMLTQAFAANVNSGLSAEHVCDVFPGLWLRWVRVTATLHATNA